MSTTKKFEPLKAKDKTKIEEEVPAIQDPTPVEESVKEIEQAEKEGKNADAPNATVEDPENTRVPPGPGATEAASFVAQSQSAQTTDNDPVDMSKEPLHPRQGVGEGLPRRHISELEGYNGKLDSVEDSKSRR